MDFSTPLVGPGGAGLQEGGKALTVGQALLVPLLGTWKEDSRTMGRKAQDVVLGLAAARGEALELSDDDRVYLKKVAFQTVPAAYLFVQICQALGYSVEELQTL